MRSWISAELDQGGQPMVIGLGHQLPLPGLLYERVHTTTIDRRLHDGSRWPLPVGMTDDSVEISVFRILGADQSYAYRDTDLHVGLRWGLIRSGFHDPEVFRARAAPPGPMVTAKSPFRSVAIRRRHSASRFWALRNPTRN